MKLSFRPKICLSVLLATVSATGFGETFGWKNTEVPDGPAMSDPIIITSLAQLEEHVQTSPTNPNPVPPGESPLYPAGPIYYPGPATGVASTSDVIIDLRTETNTVTIPIRIWQARNVRIIGLKMKLEAPAEGAKGKLKNFDGAGFIHFANPYPRVPGGAAVGVAHSHVLSIEGCDIDCNGNNIDAIVPSPNDGQSVTDQLANRKIVVINSRISGFRGHNVIDGIGEGLHCDAMQLQSGTAGEIFIENVNVESGHEGFVLNPVTDPASPAYAPPPRSLTINRVSYDIDARWIDDDPRMHQYPVALATNVPVESLKITNFEYRRLQGGDSKTGKPYSGPHGILHVSIYKPTPPNYEFNYYVDPKHAAPNLLPFKGLKLVEGTVAEGNLLANPVTKFAPVEHLGNGYKPGESLY